MKHYEAIAIQARSLDLPITFRTDLTIHDYRACSQKTESNRFIWAVGMTGTNLVWLDPLPMSSRQARSLITCYQEHDRANLYYWDGTSLSPVDSDTATKLLSS